MQNNTPKRREPKKTVSIEVRVSEQEKHAFMEACRTANRSASTVLRRLMRLFVAHQHLRHRTLKMMTRFFFHPVRAGVASFAMVAALSMSLFFSPTASADMRFAFQVLVDDGVGQIVSTGEADFASGGSVGDTLGDRVRFRLAAAPCLNSASSVCAEDDRQLVLSLWDYIDGELVTATDQGIDVSNSGETRYETRMGDGRTLVVLLAPRARG
ncbi:hypothetical protein ACWCOP_03000 [Maricaulaceae bacterium MS644]